MDLLEAVLNDTPTRLLLAASKDGKITVRTFTDSSSEQIFTQKSHKKEVLCLLFSPLKNGSFYSSGVDKTLKMFSYQSTLKSPFKETWSVSFPSPILSFDIHPSGDFIISCTSTEWIFINSHDGSVISRCEGSFSFIKFHPDGVLFAVSSNSEVLIYDIKTNSIASRFSAVVKGFSFSQNGYYLAVSKDDKIEIWDLRKQGNVFKTIECQGNVSCVEWDSFGGYLGAFVDGSVVVYQNKSFEKLKEIECAGVNGFRFGKDAKSLICACDDGQFALLN